MAWRSCWCGCGWVIVNIGESHNIKGESLYENSNDNS